MITLNCHGSCAPAVITPLPDPPPSVPDSATQADKQVYTSSEFVARSNSQTPPPNNGQVMWNTAIQDDATEVYMSKTNTKGTDVSSPVWTTSFAGRMLDIRKRQDSAIYGRYHINSVEDMGTYYKLKVTPLVGGNLPFSNSTDLMIGVI